MIMGAAFRSWAQRGELRVEHRLVAGLEATQIEPQGLLGQAADHRPRQRTQRRIQALETAALAPGGADGEPVARQLLDGKRATADLTEHGRIRHLVSLAERALQRSEERRVGEECRSRW